MGALGANEAATAGDGAREGAAPIGDAPDTQAADRPLRVAIVDDEELNLRILAGYLTSSFAGVVVATGIDGPDAIDLRFTDPPPDLMFVNGVMPTMDGWTAIETIRERETTDGLPAVPIVLDSASVTQASSQRAREVGADIYLTLPVDQIEVASVVRVLLGWTPGTRGRADAAADDLEERPLHIAVVDDEILNVRVLERFLRVGIPGAVVATGSDGRDAIALRFADAPPDLMFINGRMLEMDGWVATAEIRARERADDLPAVPIILTSADATRTTRRRSLELGADTHLAKPFDQAEILSVVRVLLGQSPGTRRRAAAGVPEPPSADGEPGAGSSPQGFALLDVLADRGWSGQRAVTIGVVDPEPSAVPALGRVVWRRMPNACLVWVPGVPQAIARRVADPPLDVILVGGAIWGVEVVATIAALRTHEVDASLSRLPIIVYTADRATIAHGRVFAADADAVVAWRPGSDEVGDPDRERASDTPPPALRAMVPRARLQPGAPPLRVVVVEDEPAIRRFIARVTTRLEPSAKIIEGGTGLEAIAFRFADPPPDLMFINEAMPILNGSDAIREIRMRERDGGLPRVPIVCETDSESLRYGLEAGADAGLAKPFSIAALTDLLARMLGLRPDDEPGSPTAAG